MLLIKGAKTMYIIVFIMILIVATIIYIVLTKIGSILKRLKCYSNDIKDIPINNDLFGQLINAL